MTATMTAPSANGKHRRTLNDSISRLDEMIDGLAGAIPETIRDTLKVAVADSIAEGVKTAVVEVLTNRELQMALAKPGRVTLRDKFREAVDSAREAAKRWKNRFVNAAVWIPKRISEKTELVWALRRPLVIAIGIGAAVGFVTAWTPPWVSATVSGIAGGAVTLAVHAWMWTRSTVGRLLMV